MNPDLGGYYWVRAIPDGPWVVVRWYVSRARDGDCGWLGKSYDWKPAEIGPRIAEPGDE